MTVEKSATVGATTTTVNLTEHGSVRITTKTGPNVYGESSVDVVYVPLDLMKAFVGAVVATEGPSELAVLREWKRNEQAAALAIAAELIGTGYKGDGIVGGVKWLVKELEAVRVIAADAHKRAVEHDVRANAVEGTLSMTVARLGGTVEGAPTGRHNFLQRVDELVKKEAAYNDTLDD